MPNDVKTEIQNDGFSVDLAGRTAVITGAATGIGSAIALRFASFGANVVVDHRSDEDYANAKELPAAIHGVGGRGSWPAPT